ncbi:hypothetical protein DPMN_126298 [Dreissena polymorpha]|nr:hypothetical protein DPMN_126298 [Dreissena polymorpha]
MVICMRAQVVRLLYYLVMFGYYMDAEDVQNLLPPLLNLLDGRHDFPFPSEKEKGIRIHQAFQQLYT